MPTQEHLLILITVVDYPLLFLAAVLLRDLRKRAYNPLGICRRELLSRLPRRQPLSIATGFCEILAGYFGREVLISACIIVPYINLIYYFTQQLIYVIHNSAIF